MDYLSVTFLLQILTAIFLLFLVHMVGAYNSNLHAKIVWAFIPLVLSSGLTLLAFGAIK